MYKAFPPLEVLISNGGSFNFSLPSVCIGKGEMKTWQEQGMTNARVEESDFFCIFSFVFCFLDFDWDVGVVVCNSFNLGG